MASKALSNVFKLHDVFNVKDPAYGAKGDGVTNDAVAIAAALAAAVAANGALYFPQGTYFVGSAGWSGFSVTGGSKFALVGDPGAVIKVAAQPTQTTSFTSVYKLLFKFVQCSDFDIRGLSFDGNNGLTVNFITMDQCSRARITGNTFQHNVKSALGLAIQTFKGSGNIINGNTFQDVGNCIWGGFTDANFHEDRLTISGNNAYDVDQDFFVGVLKNSAITGNVVKTLKKALAALSGYDGGPSFSENVAITGNYLADTDGHAVQMDITGNIQNKNITVSGNTFEDCGGYGVYVTRCLGFTVSGNTMRRCHGGVTVEAVLATGNARGSVTGNVIDGSDIAPTQQGILMTAGDVANGVSDVTCAGNVVIGAYAIGIHLTRTVTGTSRRVAITGNVVTGAASGSGIAVTGNSGDHTGVTIAGNTSLGWTNDMNIQVLDVTIGENKFETDAFSGAEVWNFTDLDATPSVKGGRKLFRAQYSGATTITNFDDGTPGQEITLIVNNANTTIQHNANIRLNAGANFAMGTNNTLTLKRMGVVWYEKARGTAT